jgi:hypothetical protein
MPARAVGFLVLACAAAPLQGQVLRGVLIESGSAQPVAAGLLQLLSGGDTVVVSVGTSERGRFAFPEVAPGRYRFRALRIGYRAWTSEPFQLAAGQIKDDTLAIPAVPVVLEEIVVEARSPCHATPQEDRRMVLLWDEVRTALGLLEAGVPDTVEFESVLIRRFVDPMDRMVAQERRTLYDLGRWPVTSQEPESLARLGYVQPRDTLEGPVYYGPDARVFFSDAFLRTHCFRLEPTPKQTPELVGLGFEPVKGRRVIDIEGTLWLERQSGALRTLEYRYVPMWDWVPRGRAGGVLSFGRLASGSLVIIGWVIRAPVARIDRLTAGRSPRDERARPFFGSGRLVLHGFRLETGEVQEIRAKDGRVLWRRPP